MKAGLKTFIPVIQVSKSGSCLNKFKRFATILLALLIASQIYAQDSISVNTKKLPVLKSLGIGPCSDVAVCGKVLYAIGSGRIYSFDISSPENPVLLGKLDGLGNVRQIEVERGYAYVTSREEGLFVIDVQNPGNMVKAAHYDTIELGTGIAVSGYLASVANRQYGVEFIDISHPQTPSFLGMTLTGEAQSVFIKDSLAFVGDWGTREMVVCNISNPGEPKIISQTKLDGFGDGVFVKDNLCFAATGHHARGWNREDKDSQYFGKGHGLEIIDISNPYNPKTLSVLKFPVVFYMLHIDMWDVQVSGNYAFVGDTEAGLFVVDVSNPQNPVLVGHAELPRVKMPDFMKSVFKKGEKSGPVGGFAIGDGVLYIAGKMDDLYVVDAKEFAVPITGKESDATTPTFFKTKKTVSSSVYLPDGQVHSVFICKNGKAFIAAGENGVHEVTLRPKLTGKQILETKSIVFDVYHHGNHLFLAEGNDGFSVWEYKRTTPPVLLGRYKSSHGGIYQLLINPGQKYAFLHAGANILEFIDLSDLKKMTCVGYDRQTAGNMYRLPLPKEMSNDRFVACSWHSPGAFFYEITRTKGIQPRGQAFPALKMFNGVAYHNEKFWAIYNGGFVTQNPPDKPRLNIEKPVMVENVKLEGNPTIYNSRMYVSHRRLGLVTAVNIDNPGSPQKVWQLDLPGNPGLVVEDKDMVVVPAGRGGLQLYNKSNGRPYYGN
jgi:hypothetical protein